MALPTLFDAVAIFTGSALLLLGFFAHKLGSKWLSWTMIGIGAFDVAIGLANVAGLIR